MTEMTRVPSSLHCLQLSANVPCVQSISLLADLFCFAYLHKHHCVFKTVGNSRKRDMLLRGLLRILYSFSLSVFFLASRQITSLSE